MRLYKETKGYSYDRLVVMDMIDNVIVSGVVFCDIQEELTTEDMIHMTNGVFPDTPNREGFNLTIFMRQAYMQGINDALTFLEKKDGQD